MSLIPALVEELLKVFVGGGGGGGLKGPSSSRNRVNTCRHKNSDFCLQSVSKCFV